MTTDTLTAELGEELIRMIKVLVAMRQHAPAQHPHVDHTHWPVLFNLREPRRVSDLAGCVHADVSTVSRQVSHLVAHGLAEKLPEPDDGRAYRVSLTAEGRALTDRIAATRGEWIARLTADWSPAEIAGFLASVTRFADALEAAKSATTQEPRR
ncbi:MAG TPA: MarR family transcriptional regulator [Dermatophilaceae bacterium]|nr:MarR family transcriptional regulator [Dermatophilaceae bacterium]